MAEGVARAGWYPDVKVPGGERYWDGERWTDQRRPAEVAASVGQPSAGWYDDPTMANTRRYWDGQKWTDHRQEKVVQVASIPSAPAATTSKSFWARPLSLGGAVVVVVVAIWLIYGGGRSLWSGNVVDSTDMAAKIEQGLSDQGVKGATLICSPVSGPVNTGDVTICDGTDGNGRKLSVQVTFNSDGSFVWRQQ